MKARSRNSPPDVAAAVRAYFARRQNRWQPISTADGIKGIRTQLSACELSDDVLAQLIAERAIKQGYDVSFDSDELQPN